MHWLFLLLALAALVLAFSTPHMWLLVLSLLAALALLLSWIRGWFAAHLSGTQADVASMVDPNALRRLRERAEARKISVTEAERGAGHGRETP